MVLYRFGCALTCEATSLACSQPRFTQSIRDGFRKLKEREGRNLVECAGDIHVGDIGEIDRIEDRQVSGNIAVAQDGEHLPCRRRRPTSSSRAATDTSALLLRTSASYGLMPAIPFSIASRVNTSPFWRRNDEDPK